MRRSNAFLGVVNVLYIDGFLGFFLLGLWIFCLVDVIVTPEGDCRHIAKGLWLIIVLIVPLFGSLIWLFAGRPQSVGRRPDGPFSRSAPRFPEYDRPGRFASADPESDEEFLRRCRERAEEQRRKGREQAGG
jgi:hypothetical protein